MILMTMMILRHVLRTGNEIRMEVMVVQMMDHKGALSDHDDHVGLAALVGEGGPGHGAHEDHALDDLLVREGLEDLLLGEGLAQGPTHRLDVRYHGFLVIYHGFLFFFVFRRVLIREPWPAPSGSWHVLGPPA